MKKIYLAVWVMVLSIALTGTLAAQSTEFTYQGRLLFGDVPANGSYDFEFALFDDATSGNQLGSAFPLSAVNVNNGVFSVRIDFGNQFPGANRFLEIHVKQTGSSTYAILSPRQSISSAPYSIKSLYATNADNAANASQLGGVTANQFVVTGDTRLSDARVPLPNSPNYIQNATSQQASSNFNVSGTGTANVFNAATQYNIGGKAVLSMPGTANLFGGISSGQANTTGAFNTFFGPSAGSGNTTGSSNSVFGNFAGNANTTGSSNSFFGESAGGRNTTASGNSFFGASAGAFSTGGSNSFFGASSGVDTTTGAFNSFFGQESGTNNTTGSGNTFIGIEAGLGNTSGSDNVFFGGQTGSNNVSGIDNTAIGTSANVATGNLSFATAIGAGSTVSTSNTIVLGRPADAVVIPGTLAVTGSTTWTGTFTANTINAANQLNIGGSRILWNPGSSNLFAGVNSGNANTTGGGNSFFGSLAGQSNTTGGDDSFYGASSGLNNTSGFNNSFFGRFTGGFNTTGSNNSIFGWFAGSNNTAGSNNSFFGVQAGASNTIGGNNSFFGSSAGYGTTTGVLNSAVGSSAGFHLTTGISNVFLGNDTGSNITIESGNSFLGSLSNSAVGLTNATAVGFRSEVDQSNSLVLGSINGKNGATADTRVGIGTTAPAKHLHIFGGGDQEIAIQSSDAGGRMWTLQSSQGASNGRFEIIDRTANASRLAIDLNGNIGISDSTPSAKLDIAVNSGQILAGDAGCNAGFTGIGFAATLAGCTNYSLVGNGTDTIINRPTGGVIHFREANSTQLAIVPGGFVGIGTTSPTAPLTVFNASTARFDLLTSSPGNPSFGYSQSVRADGLWSLSTSAGTSRIAIDGNGFVAIGGSPTPAARLSVNGALQVSGSLSVGTLVGSGSVAVCLSGTSGFLAQCSSSIRYKSNIRSFTPGLDLIKRLKPVSFTWKSDKTPDMGLVAEDVAKVEPLLVTHNAKGEVEGVKYDRVGIVLVNAVKEQQTQIEAQQKQINQQAELIKQQQSEIDTLKTLVCSRHRTARACKQTH